MPRSGRWLRRAVLALTLTSAAAAPARAAETDRVWAKPGISSAAMLSDYAGCIQAARSVQADPNSPQLRDVPTFGPVGNMINYLIFSPSERAKAQRDSLPRCMRGRGYSAIVLDAGEAAQAQALKTDADKIHWTEAFYGRADFVERLKVATAPPPSQAVAEPFAYGAVRFDAATLAAGPGVIKSGGTVLKGRARYRRTGRLRWPIEVPDFGRQRLGVDSVVQQAMFPGEDGAPGPTYWCVSVECLAGDGDHGWTVVRATGAGWIVTDIHPASENERIGDLVLSIDERADDQSRFEVALVLRKLRKDSVVLEGLISNGKDWETLWTGEAPFDAAGRAALPFWTHRLVLTRAGEGVMAAWAADGDGTALPYGRVTN